MTRALDWAATSLGPIDAWPQSLRTAAGVMLNSRHPMFLAWGPELVFLYNDAYAPILGAKHPQALGRRFADIWSEIWEDLVPLIDRALAGEATWSEDLHLVMLRNGYPEDTWYTFSYSPVRDESGAVAGMFCACNETTDKVLTERRLTFLLELGDRLRNAAGPDSVRREATEMLARALGLGRVGFVDIDPTETWAKAEDDWVDLGMGPVRGRFRLDDFGPIARELRAGKLVRVEDIRSDPRTAEAAEAFGAIGVGAAIAVPLIRHGRLVAILSAQMPRPRRWSEFDANLMRDVAERGWGAIERARAQAEVRWLAAVVEQSTNFIATARPDGSGLLLNRAARRMVGLSDDADVSTLTAADFFPPDERRRVLTDEIMPGLRERGEWAGEAEFSRFDGEGSVPVYCRVFSVRDATGETVAFATVSRDISEERRQRAALSASEARYRELADAMPQLVWTADADGAVDYYNRRREEYLGFDRQADGYYAWGPAVHPDDVDRTLEAWRRALNTGEPYECEHRIHRADGSWNWHLSRGVPARGPDGAVVKWYGSATDIEFVKRMEQARELLAREVDHRAKNALAVAQSIVKLTRASDVADYKAAVSGRIGALARAHTLLARARWSGGSLRAVLEDELAALAKPSQYELSGEDATVEPGAVQPLGMIVHELATNALKYGSLSKAEGRVRLAWTPADGDVRLTWTESGGPPVAPPERTGFGSTLLQELAGRQLGGCAQLDWRPEGLRATFTLPAAMLRAGRSEPRDEPRSAEAAAAPVERPRRGRVLVVEDNALIGLDAYDVLTRSGLEVIGPVTSVAAALDLIAHSELDAAFLDVDLHGRPSFEIADALRAAGVPFTFCTGFGELAPDSGHVGRAILRKPVSEADLLRAYDAMSES